MKDKAQLFEKIMRGACVAALAFQGASLMCVLVYAIRHLKAEDDRFVICGALAIIASLAFFSIYSCWRLWRGTLSSNGFTLLPTWFIEAFGVFVLVLIAYTAYSYPKWWLLEAIS